LLEDALQGAISYLRRLPSVPMTLEFTRSLEKRLEDSRSGGPLIRTWHAYHPVGYRLLTVHVNGEVLTVKGPTADAYKPYLWQALSGEGIRLGAGDMPKSGENARARC